VEPVEENQAYAKCTVGYDRRGDFNEAVWGFEHFFPHKRVERQMAEFKDVWLSSGMC
jgi:hypothetical protein